MIDENVVRSLIDQGEESRRVEYKGPMGWGIAKVKITKAILGLSNVSDGGWIIVGMKKMNNHYELAGIEAEDWSWISHDKIASHVSTFADPYVDFEVQIVDYNGKKFGVIRVNEFPELPVICRKGNEGEGLLNGRMYTRSRRMHETTEVNNSTDLREVLELAVRKQFMKTLRISTLDSVVGQIAPLTEQTQFDREAEGFL